ncbi:MAG: sigma-70 family RNA polymerase sigma factor [Saprospiraceae bacterium]|nr:sigma-70 family RNA polymerase sigma factor [Saprospiraceae bacterium]MCB9325733.1 sigma-70 family RNA polymerase sigma factor [Lewinellaceae bacterium]
MEYRKYSDYDLIGMAVKGREYAYSEIYRRHKSYVSNVVGKFIDDPEDRTEIVQDVFLKAFINLDKFQFSSKFTTWIYTIASRESLNYLSDKKRYIRLKKELEGHLISNKLTTYAQNTDRVLDNQAIKMILSEEVDQDNATLLNLFYLQDKTIEMISNLTGFTLSNVKVKLCRARKEFKTVLTNRFGTEVETLRYIN